jgi:hypothetical protein
MRVACVIPWRGGKRDRERHHHTVRDHLRDILPDAVHLDVDSGHQPFSRAGSRNLGVRLAQEADCDVVVINDADTLVEREPLLEAIDAAHDGVLHLPFRRYRSLTRRGLAQFNAGWNLLDCEVDHDHEWATGGVIVTTPQAWTAAGGMDERFRNWGHEDVALRVAADTLCGPTVKHSGTIHHLWHRREMGLGTPDNLANAALCERYIQAEGDADAMRALVAEHTMAHLTGVLDA